MKTAKKITAIILALLLSLSVFSLAGFCEGPPGGFGGGGSSAPSFSGAQTLTSSVNKSGGTYRSTTGSQNALLASAGTSALSAITVEKTGDSDGEDADFYGTNAAVLAYNSAVLNISDAAITTAATHANAVFAYGSGVINISDSTIKTTADNSGAVMVTGGGTLTATNVTAETDGRSSAPIRSDRGGGTLTVNGGSYTANGQGSPAIYSTADITVNDASLVSTSAEGVVIEGKNAVTLNNTALSDNNTSLNGNSETYKNIFIYQSMSGDAEQGQGSFTATDSTITTKHGDTFFVTNTTAVIKLSNNQIVNTDADGAFLRIQAGKWGNSGSNGGTVTLTADNQIIDGDIVADSISSLNMTLSAGSAYTGTINGSDSAKDISVSLDSNSTLSLTGDSYVSSLENDAADNSNINLNGYTLYVDGKAITSTAYQGAQASETTTAASTTAAETADNTEKTAVSPLLIGSIIACVAVVATAVTLVVIKRRKQARAKEKPTASKEE